MIEGEVDETIFSVNRPRPPQSPQLWGEVEFVRFSPQNWGGGGASDFGKFAPRPRPPQSPQLWGEVEFPRLSPQHWGAGGRVTNSPTNDLFLIYQSQAKKEYLL